MNLAYTAIPVFKFFSLVRLPIMGHVYFWLRVKTYFPKIEFSIMKNFIKCISINILFPQSIQQAFYFSMRERKRYQKSFLEKSREPERLISKS